MNDDSSALRNCVLAKYFKKKIAIRIQTSTNVKKIKTIVTRTLRVQTTQDHLTVSAMKAIPVLGKRVKVPDLISSGILMLL